MYETQGEIMNINKCLCGVTAVVAPELQQTIIYGNRFKSIHLHIYNIEFYIHERINAKKR